MTRVLHVLGIMDCGGIENLIMNLYRRIDKDKVQFDFLEHSQERAYFDDEIEQMGGKIYRVSPRKKSLITHYKDVWRVFKTNDHEIIHFHMTTAMEYVDVFLAKLCGKKIRIVHSHNTSGMNHQLNTALKTIFKRTPTHFFACSDMAAKWLFNGNKNYTGTYKLFCNAIDKNRYVYDSDKRTTMKNSLGLCSEFVIGHVGRFHYQKNHDFLLRVFESVCKIKENSILLLLGTGPDEKRIKQMVHQMKLEQKVKFLGVRSDVPDVMQAMDVFVLPSHYEGLPVVGIEAQAAGLPCVFSDAITKETDITGNVEFLSLDNTPEFWARKIVALQSFQRKDTSKEIDDAGYDINKAASWIQNFYLAETSKLHITEETSLNKK